MYPWGLSWLLGHYSAIAEGVGIMAVGRRSIVWVDAAGGTRLVQLTTSADASALQNAIAAHSNAAVQQLWEGALVLPGAPAPVAAEYLSTRDYARLVYQTAAGDQVSLLVPAPMADVFRADGQTVDPSAVADITAAAMDLLVTQAGTPVTGLVAGIRGRS